MASGRVTCLLCARPGLALRIKQTPSGPTALPSTCVSALLGGASRAAVARWGRVGGPTEATFLGDRYTEHWGWE